MKLATNIWTKPEPGPPPPEPEKDPIKVTLVNTPLKVDTLVRKLQACEGYIGFDTEVVGPNLRGRDFVNITHAALLGVSIAFEDGKTYYVPVRHKGRNVSFAGLEAILKEVQTLAGMDKVWAHNAKFDYQPMAQAGYPLPDLLCSMVAGWLVTGRNFGLGLKQLAEEVLGRTSPQYDPALHAKTGDQAKLYAGHDALNALQLGKHFLEQMDKDEISWFLEECAFAHALADMKLLGMRIDFSKLEQLNLKAREELARIASDWDALAPDVSITSSKQLQVLFEEGVWEPHGRTAKGQYATGKEAMRWNLEHGRGAGKTLAQLRLDYQEVAKIVNTYTEGLIEEAKQWADYKLHCDLFHFGTVTGRLASANPNLQNQPAHGDWAKFVRECFIPDPGKLFVSADYSQIELRYFAEYCGGKLLEAYKTDADLHTQTGELFKDDIPDAKLRRDVGKRINFGFLLYGGGPDRLVEVVLEFGKAAITLKRAEEIIAALAELYPAVPAWRKEVIETVGGFVEWERGRPVVSGGRGRNPWAKTIAGRKRHFPELNPAYLQHSDPEEYNRLAAHYKLKCRKRGKKPTPAGLWMSIRSRGERLVVNYLIQGGARDLLVVGMNACRQSPPKSFELVMTVHDEVLAQYDPDECHPDDAQDFLKRCLESAGPRLGLEVPIVAEPKVGVHWGEVK